MIFTILDDDHSSLICNDCITDAQLDLGYSETEIGICDDCGCHGRRIWPSQTQPAVIAKTMQQAEQWARAHDLQRLDGLRIFATSEGDVQGLDGYDFRDPGLIAVLPGAENGYNWRNYEDRLMMRERFVDFSKNTINFKVTMNAQPVIQQLTAQQYQSMLYGGHIISTTRPPAHTITLANP